MSTDLEDPGEEPNAGRVNALTDCKADERAAEDANEPRSSKRHRRYVGGEKTGLSARLVRRVWGAVCVCSLCFVCVGGG